MVRATVAGMALGRGYSDCGSSSTRSGRTQACTRAPTGAWFTLMPGSKKPPGIWMAALAPAPCSVPESTVLSPTKPATKRLLGVSYRLSTSASCWITPSLNTATRSLMVRASPWSCVT